jgi:hypothetical protein
VPEGARPPFVTHVLHGARFEGHAVPVDVLPDIAAYRELVVAVARGIFFARNPGRKRVPKGFEEGFRLVLTKITEPGCAGLPLERVAESPGAQQSLWQTDEFDEARDLIARTIEAVAAGHLAPPEFPREAATLFNAFGSSLREDERIEIGGPAISVSYDRARRKQLVLLQEKTYEDRCDVTGRVVLFDVERMTFELLVEDRRVSGRLDAVAHQLFEVVGTAAAHRGLTVRVKGRGAYDRTDRLIRFVDIEDVCYADDEALRTALDVHARLHALGDLPAGWLDGVGEALDAAGLVWLAEVLELAVSDAGPRPYLYPTPNGSVLAEWSFPDAEVAAEFDLVRRRAEVVGTYTQTQASGSREFEIDDPGVAATLLDYVMKFGPRGMART